MKKLVLFVLLISVFLTKSVLADGNFAVTVQTDEKYFAGRTGIINLYIYNNGPQDSFSISILGTPSNWLNYPVAVVVNQGQNITVPVSITPSVDALPYPYSYAISIEKGSTSERAQKQILVYVDQVSQAIIRDFSLSCMSCETKVDVSGTVQNVGTQSLLLTLTLKFGTQERVITVGDLAPLKTNAFAESFVLKGLSPGSYQVEAKLNSGSRLVYSDIRPFSIPTIEKIVYDKQASFSVFGNSVTLTAFNDGNVERTAKVTSDVVQGWYLFFSGPPPTSVSGDEYAWSFSLKPGEKTQVQYSEVFWPVYVFIVIFVLGGLFIYWQFNSFTVGKVVYDRMLKKGKEVSVSLHVKNMMRGMENVVVKDTIPSGLQLARGFETMKPLIRKITGGTELVWRIGSLKPQEERVVHYTLRPTETHGSIPLPSAVAKATFKDKTVLRKSNIVILHGEKEGIKVLPVKVSE